jgi:hypothetical protein
MAWDPKIVSAFFSFYFDDYRNCKGWTGTEENQPFLVKAREKHGVKTLPDGRLVMMFFKAPGSTKSAA